MLPGNFHVIDVAVIVAYLGTVIWFGWRSSHQTASEEGFFLAGRKLGKLYQFFLSFGNATEPQGAVSTASLVLQRGVTGVWFAFQTVFMNPYFWFMNTWFRRVRLMTLADMFEDRLGSRGLSRFYALFQVGVACALLGFGNFVAYKIASSIVIKSEAQSTPPTAPPSTAMASSSNSNSVLPPAHSRRRPARASTRCATATRAASCTATSPCCLRSRSTSPSPSSSAPT